MSWISGLGYWGSSTATSSWFCSKYGCESWTSDLALGKPIEAFELHYRGDKRWRTKKFWSEMKSNLCCGALSRPESCNVWDMLWEIRSTYKILRVILEEKIVGKRSVGRRQNAWLDDLGVDLGVHLCSCSGYKFPSVRNRTRKNCLWIILTWDNWTNS